MVLDAVVPVLQRRGTQRQPGGSRKIRRSLLSASQPTPTSQPCRALCPKYNLNFTNLNDADGSIWARYNVPWQPAYVFYRADGTSTFANKPHRGYVRAGIVRSGSGADVLAR